MKIVDHHDASLEQWRPGVQTRMVASACNGAAELCVFEQWIEPGTGAPTHRHSVEEVLTVLQGKAEMWIEESRTVVSAGQSVVIPAGRNHGFHNAGSAILHIHAVLASPIFEATFEGSAEAVRRWSPP